MLKKAPKFHKLSNLFQEQVYLLYLLCFFIPFLQGCLSTHTFSTSRHYESVYEDSCAVKVKELYLFNENEPIKFTFQILGYVEAEGGQYSSDQEVLNHLKYEAWKRCANGIIYIKKQEVERDHKPLFAPEEDREWYRTTLYSGTAVKIFQDSTFFQQYTHGIDSSKFVPSVKKNIQGVANWAVADFSISMLTGIVVIGQCR